MSGSIVASAITNSPFTYKSGGEVYPLPVFNIVNESMIHLTSLSFARFFLYPNPEDCILISVTNPLLSNKGIAVAPDPFPPIKTNGASAHASPGLSTGISIIPVSYTHLRAHET